MIYYTYKTTSVQNFIQKIFQNKISNDAIGFGMLDEPLTWVGQKTDLVNAEQLERSKITTEHTNGAGGTGVMSPGSIAIIYKANNKDKIHNFIESVFTFLIAKLQERNIICHYEGNDLVLTKGNRKLCGYSVGLTPSGNHFCGLYINIHVNIKLIDKVCVKRRAPFGLSEYGITTEEVEQWFREFWSNQRWVLL